MTEIYGELDFRMLAIFGKKKKSLTGKYYPSISALESFIERSLGFLFLQFPFSLLRPQRNWNFHGNLMLGERKHLIQSRGFFP